MNELVSLRFVESGHNAVIMGPVGVGKTVYWCVDGQASVGAPVAGQHVKARMRRVQRLSPVRSETLMDVGRRGKVFM